MTYPYGTKGAPVVGNGLGGLPRRAVAAAAAAATSRRYDLALIANSPTSFTTFATNSKSVAIMLGGKIYKYYKTDFSPQVYRWSANYSATGYSNVANTETAQTTITRLPTVSSNLVANYCWSIEYSATSGLFCYTGIPPFKVTVSGDDTSFVSVAAPASGTYENGGTWSSMQFPHNAAIISKDGKLLMVGRDNNDYIALLRYDPETLTFLGATKQSVNAFSTTVSNASTQFFTTDYGYLLGCTFSTGTNGWLTLTSFSDAFVPISHARTTVSDASESVFAHGVTVGPEGALGYFGVSAGPRGAVIGAYASPTGQIILSNSFTTNTGMGQFTTTTQQGSQLRFLRSTAPGNQSGGERAGTNIDGTIKCAFLSASSISNGDVFIQTVASSYFHIDTKPVIEKESPYHGFQNIETLCVKNNIAMTTQYCPGLCGDNEGFIYIPNTYASEGNQLLKKVYR